ncbi:YqgE/AlgH family protein [Cellulomonas sp. ICMP 17802]|uniref:YqgE/AlgH family protein n=1 Tax=Cellulomonas sp. ICMP 17802 TaxID=3239199 RepID=UPI00351BA94B
MSDGQVMRGRLLVAAPGLREPTFHRTVILLLDHSATGAVGVVLNRPSPVDVAAVLPEWHSHVADPPALFVGGPVGEDTAMGVAVLLPGARPSPDLDALTGPFGLVNLDAAPEAVAGQVRGVRVFVGFAGWGEEQLEGEIAERSWFVVDAEPADLLTREPEQLWRRVLRRQGGDLAIVSTYAEDASLN